MLAHADVVQGNLPLIVAQVDLRSDVTLQNRDTIPLVLKYNTKYYLVTIVMFVIKLAMQSYVCTVWLHCFN